MSGMPRHFKETIMEFILRGITGGDRRLVITKEAALAISAGAEIVIDDTNYEIVRIVTHLSTSAGVCYLSLSLPVLEVKPKAPVV